MAYNFDPDKWHDLALFRSISWTNEGKMKIFSQINRGIE